MAQEVHEHDELHGPNEKEDRQSRLGGEQQVDHHGTNDEHTRHYATQPATPEEALATRGRVHLTAQYARAREVTLLESANGVVRCATHTSLMGDRRWLAVETLEPVGERVVDEAEDSETEESLTDLLEALARDLSALSVAEARLTALRHDPEVRRAARGVGAAVVAAVALGTAFALLNVAVVIGLASVMPAWAAALVLAGAWALVGGVLAAVLLARTRHLHSGTVPEAERSRDEALLALRDTLGRLGPAIAREIADAVVPFAGEVADDIVEAADDLIDDIDDAVESLVEDVPGGGVVNLVWDVVLLPGRAGVRVATTVLRRGEPRG
jgi:hypothetical protein